ncbi:agglutinin-1, partial [Bacteroides nordii CL02T12C05]
MFPQNIALINVNYERYVLSSLCFL